MRLRARDREGGAFGDRDDSLGRVEEAESDAEDLAEAIAAKELLDRTALGDRPVLGKEDGPVADARREGEVVDDDGDAHAAPCEGSQNLGRREGVAWVHRGEWLVGEEELGLTRGGTLDLDECAGEGRPLPLAGAELGEGVAGAILEFDALERFRDAIGGSSPIGVGAEGDHLTNAE